MLRTTALLALMVLSCFAAAAEPSESQVAQLRIDVAALRAEVKNLAQQVAQLKDSLAAATGRSPQTATQPTPKPDSKQTPHAEWQTSFKIADLNGGQLPELKTLAVGYAGRLPGGWVTVVQVLSESESIARYRIQTARTFTLDGYTTRVPDIWEQALLTGIDTSEMADEKSYQLRGSYIVVGTRRIKTAEGGSFTYFVAAPLDEKAWRAEYEQHRKQGPPKPSKPGGN
jgi:outer membrane murein-binding lipoprotein Lpp